MVEEIEKQAIKAYCVKCKKMVEIKHPMLEIMKNKARATSGVCSICGTKVYRMGAK